MLMGLGPLGWAVALVLGFLVGGVLFLSVKAQVDYVVREQGPTWLMPVALYARMVFVAVVLILVAVRVPSSSVAGALLGGLVGVLVARVLVSRMVRGGPSQEDADGSE